MYARACTRIRAYAREEAGSAGQAESAVRFPPVTPRTQLNSVPPSPVDWHPIPLGAGQEPNAMGHDGAFQYTNEADDIDLNRTRRNPDESWTWISRVPERP